MTIWPPAPHRIMPLKTAIAERRTVDYLALAFAGLAALIFTAFFIFDKYLLPLKFGFSFLLVLAIPICSLFGLTLGILKRGSWTGKCALILSSLDLLYHIHIH